MNSHRHLLRHWLLAAVLIASCHSALAQYSWTNFAGLPGGTGNADGTGAAARFDGFTNVAVAADGTVYVADTNNSTIRKITSAGVVTTLAGSPGQSGYLDAVGSAARFSYPNAVAVDANGIVYVAEGSRIRKVTSAGVVTTLAGSGTYGNVDGIGSAASFNGAGAIAVDGSGTVYVADILSPAIRKITSAGVVTTLAGSVNGSEDGTGSAAHFGSDQGRRGPFGLATDTSGNVYVADTRNNTIRKVTSAGVVTTLAGTPQFAGIRTDGIGSAAGFAIPTGMAVDGSGNIYACDGAVRNIGININGIGVVTTRSPGDLGGSGLGMDGSGNFYMAALGPNTDGQHFGSHILKVTSAGVVSTLAGSPPHKGNTDGTGNAARFSRPEGVAVDASGNAYVVDVDNRLIRRISNAGVVTTLAGGSYNMAFPDGVGAGASFFFPSGITIDGTGTLYVSDGGSIRRVTSNGVVDTIYGGPGQPNGGLKGLAVDPSGDIYFADDIQNFVGKIHSGSMTFVPGTFNGPYGLALDGSGNLYVAEAYNATIQKITPSGAVTTLAGTAQNFGHADGAGSAAQFAYLGYMTIDPSGNLYVTDGYTIRKVTSSGVVTTIGGRYLVRSGSDGINSAALFSNISGVAVSSTGQLYVTDNENNSISRGAPITAPVIAVEQPAGTSLTSGGSPVDFGTVTTGNNTSKTFTLKNTGTANLMLGTLTIDGTNAADFSVTSAPTSPISGPSGSTTFTVKFAPTAAGAKTAALHLPSNDAGTNIFDINLTGNASASPVPEIVVEQPAGTNIADAGTKDFGSASTGSNKSLTFTIKNTGTANLTGLTITKDGANPTDFTVTASPVAPVSGPSGSTTFIVQFAPTAVGLRSAAIHIGNNDSDENPFDINLTGTGVSSNANLAGLLPSQGTLTPPFVAATTSYTATVANGMSSITITPTKAEANASITVNGVSVASGTASGPLSLTVGSSNTITTIVTAQDGTTKTYTLTVTRAAPANSKGQITSPANGSTLTSTSLPLVWNAGYGVTSYYLFVGTTPGGFDVYAGNQGTSTNYTVPSVPADRNIYVTLYSLISGAYQANNYYFKPIPAVRGALATPANGSTLAGGTLNLTWTAGTGVSGYFIFVGSTYGGFDLGAVNAGTANNWNLPVPQDGGPIYVTLYSLINGGYQAENYWFNTALPVSGNRQARITSPANTSILGSAMMNLAWDAGSGVSSYALWVGSTPNGYDLYSGLEGTSLSKSVAIPGDGRRIYVTLHSLISGAYQSNAYWFTAPTLPDGGAAQVTSPANGSTLADSTLPLVWSSAAGATQYYIFAGSTPGGYDLYSGSQGTTLNRTLIGMPVDGRAIYVTLYSWLNGAWKQSTTWFTTANTASGNRRALITSPANGTTLPAASNTFTWGGGSGVTSYALWIGSSPGSYDLWSSAESIATTSRSVTLPTDGRKIHVTLYSFISGAWQGASYIYTAANIAPTKAAMTSPVNGTTFTSASQTLNWSASNVATMYALWIGRSPGAYDIYAGAEGLNLSKTVTTLPTDGTPVYVTLYSLINGAWQSNEYIYSSWLQP